MDKIINSKVDKQSIYEIYRACRLCGAGAGYKMPIIQNVVEAEVDLKHKIRECVQIEVYQDDKMPPLICELCVDKVNDYYEFFDMCRKTNVKTRQRLGLPLQQATKGLADTGDCILGVTEPVYVNEDSNETYARSSPRNMKLKTNIKKEKIESSKKNNIQLRESRSGKTSSIQVTRKMNKYRSPSPRATRKSRSSNEDNVSISSFKQAKRPTRTNSVSLPPPPKSILKKTNKVEPPSGMKTKRQRESSRSEVPKKRVKLAVSSPPKRPEFPCSICKLVCKTSSALSSHLRTHVPSYTTDKLCCNPCREWFPSLESALSHHKRHASRKQMYKCTGCGAKYSSHQALIRHVNVDQCYPWTEVPDQQCSECWKHFPTENLLHQHKCSGVDGRPGGKCAKCNRTYALLKNLKKHESVCTAKRKTDYKISPDTLACLKPLQIRMARCDPLLTRKDLENGWYNVSTVAENYGLDTKCVYPYLKLNFNRMVNIKTELDDFFCEEDYVHWDSDHSTDEDETERRVDSLSTLSLKTLFSPKCLGRVPKKRRKVKTEKSDVFDSLVNNSEFDTDLSDNINNLIDNLGDDDVLMNSSDIDVNNKALECNSSKESMNIDNSNDDINNRLSDDNKESSLSKDDEKNEQSPNNDMVSENDVTDSNSKVDETVGNELNDDEEMTRSTGNDGNNEEVGDGTISSRSSEEKGIKNNAAEEVERDVNGSEMTNQEKESDNTINMDSEIHHKSDDTMLEENVEASICDNDKLNDDDDDNKDVNDDNNKMNDENILNENESNKSNVPIESVVNNDDISLKLNNSNSLLDAPRNSDIENDKVVDDKGEDDAITKSDLSDDVTIKNGDGKHINTFENEKHDDSTDILENKTINNDEIVNSDQINGNDDDKLNMNNFDDASDSYIDDKKLMDALDEHIGENHVDDEKNFSFDDKISDACASNKISLDDLIPKAKDSSLVLDNICDDEFEFEN